MNISTDPWIPTVLVDGSPASVSLREAFERGHEIRDLAVRPHERVAAMRLLLCVAQAAIDGPEDQGDWQDCCPRIIPAALTYLKQWDEAFELFGSGERFLQVPNLEKSAKGGKGEAGTPTSKLDLALATGNNSTLFDNGGGLERAMAPGELALGLLTFQCFSPGGRIGVAVWHGKETPGNGSSEHAPCLSGGMLHALVRGENLLETLHRNLISKQLAERFFGPDRWGRPVWEQMPRRRDDGQAVNNATSTYLGRLVPLTRSIRLAEDCSFMILANGLDYVAYPGWREPTTTIVVQKFHGQEPERMVLRASVEKAAWRELHALTVKAVGQSPGGPAALQSIPEKEDAFDLWVGGLVANQAKPVDAVESVFHVPTAMLNEPSQRVYEQGVRLAEGVGLRLRRAVSVYHKELGDNLDRSEMRTRRNRIQAKATSRFWTEIENAVPRLLAIAEQPDALGLKGQWGNTDWSKSIWRTASRAYEHACPNGTPRQMRAYSLGLKVLFTSPAVANEPESEVEVEA